MRGVDVTTSVDAGLLGASDEEHVEYAHSSERVIYTHDSDFVKLHDAGVVHSGIVYNPAGHKTIGEVVRYLCLMHDCLESGEMAGQLEFL